MPFSAAPRMRSSSLGAVEGLPVILSAILRSLPGVESKAAVLRWWLKEPLLLGKSSRELRLRRVSTGLGGASSTERIPLGDVRVGNNSFGASRDWPEGAFVGNS